MDFTTQTQTCGIDCDACPDDKKTLCEREQNAIEAYMDMKRGKDYIQGDLDDYYRLKEERGE